MNIVNLWHTVFFHSFYRSSSFTSVFWNPL